VARAQGVRQATIGGCSPERCYGPGIIGWQQKLRACAKDARIGVIDTSADVGHPALKGRRIEFGDFLPKGVEPAAGAHGTGVLTILAGNPNSGTPGLIPDAHFFAANVYRSDEGGQPVADTLTLLKAIDWMGASHVAVVNMSLSGPNDKLLERAIADMSARGVVFVAAAGNGGPGAPPSYPAAYADVVAVTAVDKNLRGYIHANHGEYIDIAAPGVDIWTALPNALEGYQSGTSFAAPHVTAILAAVQGRVRDKTKEGYLRVVSTRDLGPPGRDNIYGRGLALAPAACSHDENPGGWITSVVEPSPTTSPSIISRPAAYK
jgi:subtilisin family serine protease